MNVVMTNKKDPTKKPPMKISLSIAVILISHFSPLTSHFVQNVSADTITNESYSIDVQDIDTNPQPTNKPQEVILRPDPTIQLIRQQMIFLSHFPKEAST